MKANTFGLGMLLLLGGALAAGQEPAKGGKEDYADLSRMVHKMMVGQLPKVFETETDWGTTTPMTDKLILKGLRSTAKVDGREELLHGLWRKMSGRMEDPQRDLKVRVRALENKEGLNYRLSLDAGLTLRGESELQKWQKGLLLLDAIVLADLVIGLDLGCDVKAKPDPKKPLANVKLETQVTDLKMSLKEFTLRQVTLRRIGPVLQGETAESVGGLVKGMVESQLQSSAPQFKEQLNQAIARSAAQGEGTFPTAELLKALPPAKKK